MFSVSVEVSGGLELLFGGRRRFPVEIPPAVCIQEDKGSGTAACPIFRLIALLRDDYVAERPELFAQGDNIRPGILILINDADYELFGGREGALVHPGDEVVFISTLHGG